MKKEKIKGLIQEGTGKVKEVTGKVVGNKELEAKGKIQKNVGKAQVAYAEIEDNLEKKN